MLYLVCTKDTSSFNSIRKDSYLVKDYKRGNKKHTTTLYRDSQESSTLPTGRSERDPVEIGKTVSVKRFKETDV